MNPILVVIIVVWIVILIVAIKAFREPFKPPREYTDVPRPRMNSSKVTDEIPKEDILSTDDFSEDDVSEGDVSDTVLALLDSGKINWPMSVSDRHKFIEATIGKLWDALIDINVDANMEIGSRIENGTYDELQSADTASQIAWATLGELLVLVLVLEETLGTDVTPLLKYDKPTEISSYKAKIRSKLGSQPKK